MRKAFCCLIIACLSVLVGLLVFIITPSDVQIVLAKEAFAPLKSKGRYLVDGIGVGAESRGGEAFVVMRLKDRLGRDKSFTIKMGGDDESINALLETVSMDLEVFRGVHYIIGYDSGGEVVFRYQWTDSTWALGPSFL